MSKHKTNLKSLRKKLGYNTQIKFSNELKIKNATYNDWENSKSMIPIEKADKIALHFKVSLASVLIEGHSIDYNEDLKPFDYDKLIYNLQQLKKEKNITFEKLGNNVLNCNKQLAQKYFTNNTKITPDTLYKLSHFFEVDIDTLCGKTDNFKK